MRVLFDNGTPRGLAAAPTDHIVEEARSRGWDTLRNGELLDAAEAAGFNVLVTRADGGLSGRGSRQLLRPSPWRRLVALPKSGSRSTDKREGVHWPDGDVFGPALGSMSCVGHGCHRQCGTVLYPRW